MSSKNRAFIVSFLGGLFISFCSVSALPQKHIVRVLLAQETGAAGLWTLESSDGFSLCVYDKKLHRYAIKKRLCTISYKDGSFFVNGKRVSGAKIQLSPKNGQRFLFANNEYEGVLIIVCKDNVIYIVNHVDLESYLYSVLHSESWPGWPLEVNKAFAIASRSYVIAKIVEARKADQPFDIKNTNIHQTYRGFHTKEVLKQAVHETAGIVLTHNKKPILAMFDSCCGGVIPAHIQGVNFDQAPYLARQQPCTHCKHSKLYRWELVIDQHEFEALLRKQGIKVNQLRDISVSKKDKAGVVHEIMVRSNAGPVIVQGKTFYSWLKPLKSYCYAIQKKAKQILLKGYGYGHHLGMCQWGARAMVDKGFTYLQILDFYYPSTQLMKLRCVS